MSPPINFDGSEIQEATIDGQDVSEITIDGQQAADLIGIPDSALTQDLVAWYRFEDGDARDYASNAEFPNVTWGDSTAFDGTLNGATFQSSGGVTDFNQGVNSGAFDFDGTDDFIAGLPGNFANNLTVMCWFKGSGAGSGTEFFEGAGLVNSERQGPGQGDFGITMFADGGLVVGVGPEGAVNSNISSSATGFDDGSYHHIAFSWSNNGTLSLYIDGSFDNNTSVQGGELNESPDIGRTPIVNKFYTGLIDDVRLYDAELSGSEINAIYEDTEP